MRAVSQNPDNMAQGGLKDDFNGLITKVRAVPWDYDGKKDFFSLFAAVTIKADDEAEPFVQHYSMGDLEFFAPSKDGDNPVSLELVGYDKEGNPTWTPEDVEGPYVVPVGTREQLSNNSNWAHFLTALREAGYKKAFEAGVNGIEGVYGHWNRIPQKKRSGLVQAAPPADGQKARSNDILVITEVKEVRDLASGKSSPATSKATTSKPGAKTAPTQAASTPASAPATSGTSGSLDEKLNVLVAEAVAAAGDAGVSKSKLPPLALKGLPAADKGKGVKRIVEAEFLTAAGGDPEALLWLYDADSGTLYANA